MALRTDHDLSSSRTQAGYADGTGTTAKFDRPRDIVRHSSGALYVTDQVNNRIRLVTAAGVVTTFAGSGAQSHINGVGLAAVRDLACVAHCELTRACRLSTIQLISSLITPVILSSARCGSCHFLFSVGCTSKLHPTTNCCHESDHTHDSPPSISTTSCAR